MKRQLIYFLSWQLALYVAAGVIQGVLIPDPDLLVPIALVPWLFLGQIRSSISIQMQITWLASVLAFLVPTYVSARKFGTTKSGTAIGNAATLLWVGLVAWWERDSFYVGESPSDLVAFLRMLPALLVVSFVLTIAWVLGRWGRKKVEGPT